MKNYNKMLKVCAIGVSALSILAGVSVIPKTDVYNDTVTVEVDKGLTNLPMAKTSAESMENTNSEDVIYGMDVLAECQPWELEILEDPAVPLAGNPDETEEDDEDADDEDALEETSENAIPEG